tara:strand:+ start:8 stop:532 length:525 start_codon:yes stop_codon:yes gene_type:complete
MNKVQKGLISAAMVASVSACMPSRVELSTESGVTYLVAASHVDELRNASVVSNYFNSVTVANDIVTFDPRRSTHIVDPDEETDRPSPYSNAHGDLVEVFDFSSRQRYVIDRERNLSSIVEDAEEGVVIGEYATTDFTSLSPDLVARAEQFRALGTGDYVENIKQISEPFIFDNE